MPCLYRLAFEIISPGSVLDWFSVSGPDWQGAFWAPQLWSTEEHHHRSHHGIYLALCIFFSLIGSVFCYHSSHSAVFGFWLKAGGVKFVNAPGFPCRFCAFVYLYSLTLLLPLRKRNDICFFFFFDTRLLALVWLLLVISLDIAAACRGNHHPSRMIAERCVFL